LKLATWNLQRRPLSDLASAPMDAQIRTDLLRDLIKETDVIFLQEVPDDLYQAARDQSQSVLHGVLTSKNYRLYANPKADGQPEHQACRNLIVALQGHRLLDDTFMSGGEGFRYPVSIRGDGLHTRIFTSGHFTSSDSAAENLRSYITKKPHIPGDSNDWRWVIGADFNFSAASNNTGSFVRISQPAEFTHESGSILDGFYCELHGNVPQSQFRQTERWQAPGRTTQMRFGAGPEAGYCCIVEDNVTLSGRSKSGSQCYKISDHSPVVTEFG
jgi:hypothetical protein